MSNAMLFNDGVRFLKNEPSVHSLSAEHCHASLSVALDAYVNVTHLGRNALKHSVNEKKLRVKMFYFPFNHRFT